jgi:hypothetical protein
LRFFLLKPRAFQPILLAALAGGSLAVACQGPDEYFRNGAFSGGAGGATATGGAGAGLAPGSGGVSALGGFPATGGVTDTGGVAGTGGVPGTGGSSSGMAGAGAAGARGTGGAAGTAGGGGQAGSAGAAGTGGMAAITCTTQKICVEANCADPAKANPQQFSLQVDILNNSAGSLPLSDVTFRYWFTLGETTDPPTLNVDYWMYGSGNVTSKFVAVSPPVAGANEYLEIGFKNGTQTLPLYTDSTNIQLRLHAQGYSSMFDTMQPADYSFQKCGPGQAAGTSVVTPAPTITGYIKGVLVWGAEPR